MIMNVHEITTKTLEHPEPGSRDTWCIYYPDLFKKSRLQVNKLWQVLFHEVCPYYYAMKIMINNSNEFLLEIMTFTIHFISNWIAAILGKNINIDPLQFILRWYYTGRFARTILSATQPCNIVAILFRIAETLFQHCNNVFSEKSSVANRPV